MRLAISNIAWDEADNAVISKSLSADGVAGIEVAPTRLWPGWAGATADAGRSARRQFGLLGLQVPALQSVLFGRPELQMFGNKEVRRDLLAHLAWVAELAAALGAPGIVFGSPRNRDRGTLSHAQAMTESLPLLRAIGDACAAAATCLCLEPNPEAYGCNFLTRWHDVAELVARVDHPGVGIHLDTACIHLAGDDAAEALAACGPTMRHFHVSEPELGGFAAPAIDHRRIGAALRGCGYTGHVSIEMRRQADPPASVRQAIAFVRGHYG